MSGKSRKKLEKTKPIKEENVLAAILADVDTLFRRHATAIRDIREESEQKIVTVSFATKIDCSESEPTVEVQIAYAQRVTDRITSRLDDPNQGTFQTMTPEQLKAEKAEKNTDETPRKKRGGKKDEEAEPETPPAEAVEA